MLQMMVCAKEESSILVTWRGGENTSSVFTLLGTHTSHQQYYPTSQSFILLAFRNSRLHDPDSDSGKLRTVPSHITGAIA